MISILSQMVEIFKSLLITDPVGINDPAIDSPVADPNQRLQFAIDHNQGWIIRDIKSQMSGWDFLILVDTVIGDDHYHAGRFLYSFLAQKGFFDVLKELAEYGPYDDFLFWSVYHHRWDMVVFCEEKQPFRPKIELRSLLEGACASDQWQLAEQLIQHGADVTQSVTVHACHSPETLNVLIRHGCPCHVAIQQRASEMGMDRIHNHPDVDDVLNIQLGWYSSDYEDHASFEAENICYQCPMCQHVSHAENGYIISDYVSPYVMIWCEHCGARITLDVLTQTPPEPKYIWKPDAHAQALFQTFGEDSSQPIWGVTVPVMKVQRIIADRLKDYRATRPTTQHEIVMFIRSGYHPSVAETYGYQKQDNVSEEGDFDELGLGLQIDTFDVTSCQHLLNVQHDGILIYLQVVTPEGQLVFHKYWGD